MLYAFVTLGCALLAGILLSVGAARPSGRVGHVVAPLAFGGGMVALLVFGGLLIWGHLFGLLHW